MIDETDLFDDFVESFDRKEREKVEDDRWADLWQELYSTMAESHVDLIKEQEQNMVKALHQGKKPEIPRLLDFAHHMVSLSYYNQLSHKLTLPEEVGEILIRYPKYPRLKDKIYCRQCDYPLPLGEIEGTTWITCPVCGAAIRGTFDK